MNQSTMFNLEVNEELFNSVFSEYDYEIMIAKDNATAKVLAKLSKYLRVTHSELARQGKTMITFKEKSEYKKASSQLYAEVVEKIKLPASITEYMPSLYIQDFTAIKVIGEVASASAKAFEYEVLFDTDLTFIMIKDSKKVLMLDLIHNVVMDNTYTENETDAILYTLAFVVSCFKNVSSNVISLEDYKRRKNIK